MNIQDEILANPILRNVQEKFELQTAKGLAKYGETVNPSSYSVEGWLNHLQQELIDGAVYVETVLNKLNVERLIQENKKLRGALEHITEYDRPGLLITTHTHNGMVSIAKEALEESK